MGCGASKGQAISPVNVPKTANPQMAEKKHTSALGPPDIVIHKSHTVVHYNLQSAPQ
jgi:hypothetical protein